MMKKEYRELHPWWTKKPQDYICGVVITPDLDSIMAAAVHLSVYPNDKIIGYYDFRKEYILVGDHKVQDVIYVDANMANRKCWSNHPTYLVDGDRHFVLNEHSANLNLWFGPRHMVEFVNKVHFSTTLHMLSFYGFDLTKLDEEALAVVTKLDGTADTFLRDNDAWKEKDRMLLHEVLGYGFIADLASGWNKKFLNGLDIKYRIHGRIQCEGTECHLKTNIDLDRIGPLFEPIGLKLSLPEGRFRLTKTFYYKRTYPNPSALPRKEMIYSNCWHTKNRVLYSILAGIHA